MALWDKLNGSESLVAATIEFTRVEAWKLK